ncbi:serine/arginine repetitive matrix protein 2-like [Hylaeus anthracinus]|uniref:serine/arginine repetitive matrix protein 2-like n=1 Tax=Hylaeus anthracinus TaxID=313031 RepID=UPI0023B97EC5|nr:serine/arginine repetitive matrix protein 2-like [Hylaeus anthracinus]
MGHPSNPRLMNRVLDAVVHLRGIKGSTARDVLDFLRGTSKSTPRNLTMQVHRALKHAVNAGLLRHRSGRYKALFTLNPAPLKQSETEDNDGESLERMTTLDGVPSARRSSSDCRDENRGKRKKQHRDKRSKRSRSRQKRRRRRSGSRKEERPVEHMGKMRNLKYKEKVERDRSPRRRISESRMKADIGNASSFNRKRGKVKSRDQEYYSDLSDNSDYEDRKTRGRRKTPARQECKCSVTGKSRRSVSRNRSPQRQKSQEPQLKLSHDDVKNNKIDPDDRGNADRNDAPDQDIDKDRKPNNSGSGSSL